MTQSYAVVFIDSGDTGTIASKRFESLEVAALEATARNNKLSDESLEHLGKWFPVSINSEH